MPIERVHSFLVHPAKNEEDQPRISGTTIRAQQEALYQMLAKVYQRSPQECDIPIIFRRREDGRQVNPCRDLIVAYAQQPTLPNGRRLAARLQSISTNRSGLGLIFLMKGTEDNEHVVLLSRFPADQGVVVQEHAEQLDVEFIERVFMKNAKAYKSALYSHRSFEPGSFWKGFAVDLQISGPRELSDYWIGEFLDSDLATTAAAGSKRLAVALMAAVKNAPTAEIRSQLVAATQLLDGQNGRRQSASALLERVGLSNEAIKIIAAAYPGGARLMEDTFQMSAEEFRRFAAYRAVELSNGGLLIGEDARFDEIFEEQLIDVHQRRVRYSTEGKVVKETLRKLP